jgi:ATP-dependent DNA helicase RecG
MEINKLIEDERIELKQEYTYDIVESAVAFANTNGGTIYVGIQDNGEILGVDDADLTQRKISNSLNKAVCPDIVLLISISVIVIEGKNIIRLIVQSGPQKPYYIKKEGISTKGVFTRIGSENCHASDDMILKLIKESSSKNFEELISINQELTFLSAEKIFKDNGVEFGDRQKITLGILTRDGLFTNVGLMLSDQCPQSIKIAAYADKTKKLFIDSEIIVGSIFDQLEKASDFLNRHNPTSAEIIGLKRVEQISYPGIALREVLLNAVIHRDYSIKASTLISIFPDSVTFTTYGGLPSGISIEDIYGGYSVLRNEKIADIFYKLHYIEAYATGFPKIFDSYENFDVTPLLSSTTNTFKITLPNINFQNNIEFSTDQHSGHDIFQPDDQQSIIEYLSVFDQGFTRIELENKLGISKPTALKLLANLLESNKVHKFGTGKSVKYFISENN